jgi:hypothetical protein
VTPPGGSRWVIRGGTPEEVPEWVSLWQVQIPEFPGDPQWCPTSGSLTRSPMRGPEILPQGYPNGVPRNCPQRGSQGGSPSVVPCGCPQGDFPQIGPTRGAPRWSSNGGHKKVSTEGAPNDGPQSGSSNPAQVSPPSPASSVHQLVSHTGNPPRASPKRGPARVVLVFPPGGPPNAPTQEASLRGHPKAGPSRSIAEKTPNGGP